MWPEPSMRPKVPQDAIYATFITAKTYTTCFTGRGGALRLHLRLQGLRKLAAAGTLFIGVDPPPELGCGMKPRTTSTQPRSNEGNRAAHAAASTASVKS